MPNGMVVHKVITCKSFNSRKEVYISRCIKNINAEI